MPILHIIRERADKEALLSRRRWRKPQPTDEKDFDARDSSKNPKLLTYLKCQEAKKKGHGLRAQRNGDQSPPYHFCADLKRSRALCKHLVHQLDPMHQRAQGHSGTGWRLPLTATVNFQHNQFMCSSIITICVPHKEDSPEEQNSAGCSSSP